MPIQNPKKEFIISLSKIDKQIFIHEFLQLCTLQFRLIQSDTELNQYLFIKRRFLLHALYYIDIRFKQISGEENLIEVEISKSGHHDLKNVDEIYKATKILNQITNNIHKCLPEKLTLGSNQQEDEKPNAILILKSIVYILICLGCFLFTWYLLLR